MSRKLDELEEWLARVSGADWTWHLKYLSANDTYAKSNVHQGGPYLGKELLRLAFPLLTERADRNINPDLTIPVHLVSHGMFQDIRIVWYNSRRVERRANGRDEARMTQWGGREHPLLQEASTGALVVLAFHQTSPVQDADGCDIWVAENLEEEDAILATVSAVEPGHGIVFVPSRGVVTEDSAAESPCTLHGSELLDVWRTEFPSGEEILEMVLLRVTGSRRLPVDDRLVKRRKCEFELFLSIENHVVLPKVKDGFKTVDEFVTYANSVTNRRKSRAGRSLELQVRAIFNEEEVPFSWTPQTEEKRTPDFIFPSIDRYRDRSWPDHKLRMLAAKTTCKDRWRQILNEAERVSRKHLLTLQEGVSLAQFREMTDEGVLLVVPEALRASYPESVQGELVSLQDFVRDAKGLES